MAKYNGHKNWNHWNVSLWINNDQGLYQMASYYCRIYTRDHAAKELLTSLLHQGETHTPDGAPYSVTTIKAAMRGM